MADLETQIIATVGRRSYIPLKPKALARKLGVVGSQYAHFRNVLRTLLKQGRVQLGKNHTVRQAPPHGTATGVFRKAGGGFGFVRPHAVDGQVGPEIFIPQDDVLDASSGDEVLVRIVSKTGRGGLGPRGEIVQIIERATRQFVGTYFEREGNGYVRVDGTVFSHSIYVGDPGAKGARPEDKVVIEMLRFPGPEGRGEGVISEILGPRGKPGVDTLSIIREFGLPDKFADDALEEARAAAASFDENDLDGREDFTNELTVTIDPIDARDFDDAVSLEQDAKTKHWFLGVHIADVGHFAPPGSALDREAKARGNSVYLPQRVIPMFPEIISNSLASLQQGRVRYVKTAVIEFAPDGAKIGVRFANGAIRVRRRFAYEQVSAFLAAHDARKAQADGALHSPDHAKQSKKGKKSPPPHEEAPHVEPDVGALLLRMRELAMILRERRIRRGSLELNMPEVELEFDDQGRVKGAHFASHDVSHQIIEEFMLAANEAVAEHLDSLGVPFLRRVHPPPDSEKLRAFAEFARILGYKVDRKSVV